MGLVLAAGGVGFLATRSDNPIQLVAIACSAFVAFILLAPLKIELKECNNTRSEKIRQDHLAKELKFSWRRALLLATICIGIIVGAIWLMRV